MKRGLGGGGRASFLGAGEGRYGTARTDLKEEAKSLPESMASSSSSSKRGSRGLLVRWFHLLVVILGVVVVVAVVVVAVGLAVAVVVLS